MSRRTREHRHRRRRPAAKHRPSPPPLGPSNRTPPPHREIFPLIVEPPRRAAAKRVSATIALIFGGGLGLLTAGIADVQSSAPETSIFSGSSVSAALLILGAWGWHLGARWSARASARTATWPAYIDASIVGIAILAATPTVWVARSLGDLAHARFILPGFSGAVTECASACVAVVLPAVATGLLLRMREPDPEVRLHRVLAALLACFAIGALVKLLPRVVPPRVAMQAASLPCLIAVCVLALMRRDTGRSPAAGSIAAIEPAAGCGDGSLVSCAAALLAIALVSAFAVRAPASADLSPAIAAALGSAATIIGVAFGLGRSRIRPLQYCRIGPVTLVTGTASSAVLLLETVGILKPGTLSAALTIGLRALVAFAAGAALESVVRRLARAERPIDEFIVRAMLVAGISCWLAGVARWPVAPPLALGLAVVGLRLRYAERSAARARN